MGGRITVESVVRCLWNGWPDDRGIRTLGITEIELEVVTRALAAEFTSLEVKVMGAACEVPSPALSVQS